MKNKKKSNGYVARLTITTRVGAIALLVAFIFTVLFLYFPNKKEFLRFVAGAVAAAAAVTSAFYIGQNLRQTIASEKMDRTLLFAARWNDPNFFDPRQAFRQVMYELVREMEQDPQKDRLTLIKGLVTVNPAHEQNLTCVLNFFEEMAVAVNRGIVDEGLIEEYFHTMIVKCYSNLKPWINEVRSMRGERIFRDFIKLAERWANS